MATLYALNMTADLSGDSTGFFNPYTNSAGNARCWYSIPSGGSNWTACNNGNNNSDTWGPTLTFHRNPQTPSDQVQFAVFPTNLPTGVTISSAGIFVIFGRQARVNAPNATASPFTTGNNARCFLGGEGPSTYGSAYFIGPYTVNINTGAVPNNGTLKFEFSMVCSIRLSNGQTYEYGYDPEMDLGVEP